MNISLTPALEQFVNDKVATGLYNSVSEVIREALRLLFFYIINTNMEGIVIGIWYISIYFPYVSCYK